MEILLATHNKHKAEEFIAILSPNFQIKTLEDIGFTKEIVEDGKTFEENAFIKANASYQFSKMPSIADDTGLVIETLDGRPGLYSARYAGTGIAKDNRKKVLSEMKNMSNRKAYFISVLCWYDGVDTFFFEGKINGKIAKKESGKHGFGYDSIFIPEGYSQSFAELGDELKNTLSHRAIAIQKFYEFLIQRSL